ncbi:MAG: hypothetical protein K9N51_00970 [Candidatus Pacebacteria bacterium]|nr:hypothetical protein [Candidatus Paceibacterota bacterium]
MHSKEYLESSLDALSFPIRLIGNYEAGDAPSALSFYQSFTRGVYDLTIKLEEPEHNQLLLILLDDKPIEALGVPFWGDSDDNWPESRRDRVTGETYEFTQDVKKRYGLPQLYEKRREKRRTWDLKASFAVQDDGVHKLTVVNANGDRCGPVFYKGDGVSIVDVTVAKGALRAPDTFARRNPGLPMLDAWGWMVYVDFDNPSERETASSHVLSEGIMRAKKWGANLLEVNPAVHDGHFFDFEAHGGPVPGTIKSERTSWTTAELRDLFVRCHEQGMLVELFLFAIGGFESFRTLTPDQISYFYEHIYQLFGCGKTREETEAAIDGVIYEMFPHDAPRQTDEGWVNNPGLAQTVSGGVTGTAMELKNNGFSAAFANYTAHWVGAPAHHTGYDCLFPAVPYPKEFYQREGEIAVSYLQGCAESRRLFENGMLRTGYAGMGMPGRTAAPDWIVAQLQGFAQRRWRDEDDSVASLLCWEALNGEICPEPTKRALYAASQDPIRACVTGELTDTGRGGTIDMKRLVKRAPEEDLVRLLPRHDYPSSCRFLRNQEIEILHFPGKDYNVMQLDLTRSARFYANGCLAQAFAPLFCNGADGDSVTHFSEAYRVVEAGGALAAVEQTFAVRHSFYRYDETRRLRLLSDVPGIRINVWRTTSGDGPRECRISNIMGFSSAYTAACRLGDAGGLTVELRDSTGVLPNALIRVTCRGVAVDNVRAENALVFDTALEEVHALDITVLFAAGHLEGLDLVTLERLADSLFEVAQEDIGAPGTAIAFANTLGVSHTALSALTGNVRGPVRVKEDGWWHYRGLTESDEFPAVHFVKLHLRNGDTAELAEARFPIDDELTWGWGSQYQLLLSDVARDGEWFSAHIRVCTTTPFLFAPRVRLREVPGSMTLNGAPWDYADGTDVFLPNAVGDYDLRWTQGTVSKPRLCRTFATVRKCEFDGAHLHLELCKPPHVVKDVGTHRYFALVDTGLERKVYPVELGVTRLCLSHTSD